MNVKCKYPDCDRLKGETAWCHAHYKQKARHGGMRPLLPKNTLRVCSVPNCGKKHQALGFCPHHYLVYSAGTIVDPETDRSCSVDGCHFKHYAKDLCQSHYKIIYNLKITERMEKLVDKRIYK